MLYFPAAPTCWPQSWLELSRKHLIPLMYNFTPIPSFLCSFNANALGTYHVPGTALELRHRGETSTKAGCYSSARFQLMYCFSVSLPWMTPPKWAPPPLFSISVPSSLFNLFCLYSWRILLLGIESSSSFQHFEDVVMLFHGFHCFWPQVIDHSNHCCPTCAIFLSIFVFSAAVLWCVCDLLVFILLRVSWTSWTCSLYLSPNLKKYWPLFF